MPLPKIVAFHPIRLNLCLKQQLRRNQLRISLPIMASDQKFCYVLFILMSIEAAGQSFGAYQEQL
jgi:hypothetical protein